MLCWLQLSLFVLVLRLKQALVGYLGNVLNLSRTLTPENVSLFVVCDNVEMHCIACVYIKDTIGRISVILTTQVGQCQINTIPFCAIFQSAID